MQVKILSSEIKHLTNTPGGYILYLQTQNTPLGYFTFHVMSILAAQTISEEHYFEGEKYGRDRKG